MSASSHGRSPYTRVVVVAALLLPATLLAHALVLFFDAPSTAATCAHVVALVPSNWPATSTETSVDLCARDFERTFSEPHPSLLTRLRNANLRRCLSRVEPVDQTVSAGSFGDCVQRWNDGWAGQLLRMP